LVSPTLIFVETWMVGCPLQVSGNIFLSGDTNIYWCSKKQNLVFFVYYKGSKVKICCSCYSRMFLSSKAWQWFTSSYN